MRNIILWGLVVYYLFTGLYLAIAPYSFYMTAPGVTDTGPYNMHFVRDVGFAFTVSALGLAYGIREQLKPLILFGALWLVVHGVFHLVLFAMHSDHLSPTPLIDVVLVVLPAALLAYLVTTYEVTVSD